MPGSPPQARPNARQNATKPLYRQHFLGLISGSRGRFASPPQVIGSFWGNEPTLQKRNSQRGVPWSFATSAQQEPAQRKTRRGVPPGHVAYFFNCALTIRDSGNASQDKTRLRLFWRGVRPRIRKHRPCGTTCGWRGVNATGRHHLFPNLIRELIGRGCPRSVGPVAGAADSVAHGRVFPAVSLQGSGE